MIENVLKPTKKDKLVAFSNDGKLHRILDQDDGSLHKKAWFASKDLERFIIGEAKLDDYKMESKNQKFVITKKKKAEISIIRFNAIAEIRQDDNPDVIITMTPSKISIKVSKETRDVFRNHPASRGSGILGEKDHPFYITLKNRPEFILAEYNVPIDRLLCGSKFEFDHAFDLSNISMYTRKYLELYNLEIKD